MSFELDAAQDESTNVRRILAERLDHALADLSPRRARSPDGIHAARKRLKEIRATLRLARPAIAKRRYRELNAAVRKAARPLSAVRDARALVQALDALVEHFANELKPRAFGPVRNLLLKRGRRLRGEAMASHALGSARRIVARTRRRVDRARIDRIAERDLAAGISATYRSGRRALRAAVAEHSDETLHEWRKQTKYLRHEAEILRPVWRVVIEALAEAADETADLLGDDHDLAVMKDVLDGEIRGDVRGRERKALLALIEERRRSLQKKALRIGRNLYAEKPRAFRKRIRAYLDRWP